MKKRFEVRIIGLKCDVPGCGYHNPDIECKDYKAWIDAPCPRCGASLLTQADYRAVKILLFFAKLANFIFGPSKEGDTQIIVPLEMDGSGSIELGEPKPEAE